jgi:hypothetical protein
MQLDLVKISGFILHPIFTGTQIKYKLQKNQVCIFYLV